MEKVPGWHVTGMTVTPRISGDVAIELQIVQWVPFNERWGQHQTEEVGNWTVNHDPTRHVNVASGGNFFPVGHIVDHHQYPHPAFPFEHGEGGRFDEFVKVVGEFGGHGFPVEQHLWDPAARNWGYG